MRVKSKPGVLSIAIITTIIIVIIVIVTIIIIILITIIMMGVWGKDGMQSPTRTSRT